MSQLSLEKAYESQQFPLIKELTLDPALGRISLKVGTKKNSWNWTLASLKPADCCPGEDGTLTALGQVVFQGPLSETPELLLPPGGRADFLLPQHPETILDSKEIFLPETHPGMWIAREISSGNAGGHLDWEELLARQLRDKPSRFLGRKGNYESGI